MSCRKHIADFEKRSVLLFAAFTLSAASATFAQSAAAKSGSARELGAELQQTDRSGDKSLDKEGTVAAPSVTRRF